MDQCNSLISACIICYNQQATIAQTIDGALMQEVKAKYKIQIFDDCSNDDTLDICLDFQKKYPEIIEVQSNPTNLGMVGNWLKAVTNCQSKYIALCEGDDYWTDKNKLQRQVDFLEDNPEFSVSAENSLVVNSVSNVEYKFSDLDTTNLEIDDIIPDRKFHTASVVFRRDSLLLSEDFVKSPICDTFLFISLGKKGKINYRNVVSSVYNRNHNGATIVDKSNWAKKIEETCKILDKLTDYKYTPKLNKGIAEHYLSSYHHHKGNFELLKAFTSIIKVLKYDPEVFYYYAKIKNLLKH